MNTVFISLLMLVVISLFLVENAYAETIFQRDQGTGLSSDDCKKRFDIISSNFEPILDLAKLKAESHPIFKKLTEDTSYKLISTGVRASYFSELCNTDLPSFELHYAIGDTSDSYTRIYMGLDYISYDVHQITTMVIDSSWIDPPTTQPLPFYITHWDMIHMLGEYTNSEPPKESQIFKIPYLANNGKINHINSKQGMITADVSINDGGIFALKIPRNYPYTDHDDSVHSGHGFDPFVLVDDPRDALFAHVTKTDCYYDVWMYVSGNKTLEIGTSISYLQGKPKHGDNDVPEFCLIKTIFDKNTEHLTKLSPDKQVQQGVSPYLVYCKDGLYFILKNDGSPACVSKNTQTSLWNRNWAEKSIGVYKTYSTPQILNEFHSKLISKENALKIVKEFIDETNLVLNADKNNSDFRITSNLEYHTLKRQTMFEIDPATGLPTDIASPELEGFYRTPNWYAELQRDYLGMPNHRIEDGHVTWEVSYRNCMLCQGYSSFYVDAITGKVFDTKNVAKMFAVSDEVVNEH